MKKFYFLYLALASSLALSQQIISFETDEGFEIGTIHNQNGWTVTEGNDGFIENQIITDETASDGSFSFKNSYESDFDFQWFPIFGASKLFDETYSNEYFSLSYDIQLTELMGADFEFTIFSMDASEYFYPIAGVGMEYQGNMYVINSIDYDFEMVEGVEWTIDEWYNIRIEINPDEIKYYFNNELVYTGENYNSVEIAGFNMLHNNYGGSAYYDNFIIQTEEEDLNVNDLNSNEFSIHPNPVRETLNINIDQNISNIEIYSMTGQKIKPFKQISNINVSDLNKGTYLLKITTENGEVFTKKFIKL